jgi:hypothetical protein
MIGAQFVLLLREPRDLAFADTRGASRSRSPGIWAMICAGW